MEVVGRLGTKRKKSVWVREAKVADRIGKEKKNKGPVGVGFTVAWVAMLVGRFDGC